MVLRWHAFVQVGLLPLSATSVPLWYLLTIAAATTAVTVPPFMLAASASVLASALSLRLPAVAVTTVPASLTNWSYINASRSQCGQRALLRLMLAGVKKLLQIVCSGLNQLVLGAETTLIAAARIQLPFAQQVDQISRRPVLSCE